MTELNPYEFIITIDGDVEDVLKGGTAQLQLTNPHKTGEYHVPTLSYLKLIVSKLNLLKPKKKLPSDAEIRKKVRDLIFETSSETKVGLMMEIYKKAWEEAQ